MREQPVASLLGELDLRLARTEAIALLAGLAHRRVQVGERLRSRPRPCRRRARRRARHRSAPTPASAAWAPAAGRRGHGRVGRRVGPVRRAARGGQGRVPEGPASPLRALRPAPPRASTNTASVLPFPATGDLLALRLRAHGARAGSGRDSNRGRAGSRGRRCRRTAPCAMPQFTFELRVFSAALPHPLPPSAPSRRCAVRPELENPAVAGLSWRADEGTRTPDPLLTMEVLYQLSYVARQWGEQDSNLRRLSQWIYSRISFSHSDIPPSVGGADCRRGFVGLPGRQWAAGVDFELGVLGPAQLNPRPTLEVGGGNAPAAAIANQNEQVVEA